MVGKPRHFNCIPSAKLKSMCCNCVFHPPNGRFKWGCQTIIMFIWYLFSRCSDSVSLIFINGLITNVIMEWKNNMEKMQITNWRTEGEAPYQQVQWFYQPWFLICLVWSPCHVHLTLLHSNIDHRRMVLRCMVFRNEPFQWRPNCLRVSKIVSNLDGLDLNINTQFRFKKNAHPWQYENEIYLT